MKTSTQVLLYSLLAAFLAGILSTAVILLFTNYAANAGHWSQLSSPPEDATAILQMDEDQGIVQGKSGMVYNCVEGNLACNALEIPEGGVLAPCTHLDPQDKQLKHPRGQKSQVLDACQAIINDEIVYTVTLLLYADNSLWLGEAGGTTLPMYGAEFFLICIFTLGALPAFFISWAILRARARRRAAENQQPPEPKTSPG